MVFHRYHCNLWADIGFVMICFIVLWLVLLLPLTKTLKFHTYLKEKSVWQQKLYYKYSIPIKSIQFCAALAVDKGYEKFVFDSATEPGNCTLCSYCPEVGQIINAEEVHNFIWSKLNVFQLKLK